MENEQRSGRFKHPAVVTALASLCWGQAKPYLNDGDELRIVPKPSLALAITAVYIFYLIYLIMN